MATIKHRPKHEPIQVGTVFGRWVTVGPEYWDAAKRAIMVPCKCQCAAKTEKVVQTRHLLSGHSTSCRCVMHEGACATNLRHGHAARGVSTRTYGIWSSMRARCRCPNATKYELYGGRGITVCERWMTFENFLSDMGEAPPDESIDRIDNDGNYTPENCRWATRVQQGRNKRCNTMLTFSGVTMCIAEWSARLGISNYLLYARKKRGWSDEHALMTRVKTKGS